jgi:seryl-tRNA synthetase
VMLN